MDTFHLVLEGLARIRLPRSLPPVLSILPPIPLTTSTFSLPLSALSSQFTDLLPLAKVVLPSQLHDRLDTVPPALLSDLLVSILNVAWEKRVELLGVPDAETRSRRVKELLSAYIASKGIEPPVEETNGHEPLPPQSQSMALVRRPARQNRPTGQSDLPEDLQVLQETLERRREELSTEALSAVNRELKRLTKIPPQSAEYGVGRTYIEWLLSLPWRKVSHMNEKLDLEAARRKLDDEHEGLEAVKRRVVEYLAVYR